MVQLFLLEMKLFYGLLNYISMRLIYKLCKLLIELIFRAMQVDHQIFALGRLDITGNGSDDIVASAWDGQTYILDQSKNCIRFQVEEPVAAFCTGNYSVSSGTTTPSLVYHTFSKKVVFYELKKNTFEIHY